MENYERAIELLKLYFDEWKFRQESLWKRMIQFAIIIFFVSTLPITVGVFEGVQMPNLPLLTFPIVGIFFSIFFVLFCQCESARINAIDNKIKTIINDFYPEKYQKSTLMSLYQKDKEANRLFNAKMAIWVPFFLGSAQIVIAVLVLCLISTNNL